MKCYCEVSDSEIVTIPNHEFYYRSVPFKNVITHSIDWMGELEHKACGKRYYGEHIPFSKRELYDYDFSRASTR